MNDPDDLYSRLHPSEEGNNNGDSIEGPIAVSYMEGVESARIVSVSDEVDGARAVLEQLGHMGLDEDLNDMAFGDEEVCFVCFCMDGWQCLLAYLWYTLFILLCVVALVRMSVIAVNCRACHSTLDHCMQSMLIPVWIIKQHAYH